MLTAISTQEKTARRLLQLGVLLFLLGLLTGFAVPAFANPRMGLASHLEGVMNGIFLIALGLMWTKLNLSARWLNAAFRLALFGTFVNWACTLLAATWGAGVMMPIAGQGQTGTPIQENIIRILLTLLSLAMVSVCVLVLIGLRESRESRE